ncbi:hypothetical protein HanRHA438_Chr04g0184771 [Helianthus annuus]|nr:hypothetical protein HanRHA438_Chr04g0184771 [Helianthus annuus]
MASPASKLTSMCILLLVFASASGLGTTSFRGIGSMERSGVNSRQFLNDLVLELNYNNRKLISTSRVAPGGPDGQHH